MLADAQCCCRSFFASGLPGTAALRGDVPAQLSGNRDEGIMALLNPRLGVITLPAPSSGSAAARCWQRAVTGHRGSAGRYRIGNIALLDRARIARRSSGDGPRARARLWRCCSAGLRCAACRPDTADKLFAGQKHAVGAGCRAVSAPPAPLFRRGCEASAARVRAGPSCRRSGLGRPCPDDPADLGWEERASVMRLRARAVCATRGGRAAGDRRRYVTLKPGRLRCTSPCCMARWPRQPPQPAVSAAPYALRCAKRTPLKDRAATRHWGIAR